MSTKPSSTNYSLFKAQTKKNWKKNIENRNIISQYRDHKYDPIYFYDESIRKRTFNQHNNWDINVEINITTESNANQEAIEYLNLGVDSLCFVNFKKHNLSEVLKNIQLELINISFKDFSNIDVIISQLQEIGKSKKIDARKLNGTFYNKSISQKQYQNCVKILPNYKFLTKEISFKQKYKNHKYIDNKHILFRHKTTENILYEIAKIRAFRIHFEHELGITPYIECLVDIKSQKTNPLIDSCVRSIASVLGGCSGLIINSNIDTKLNIQQQLILKYEANLNKVSDALHGSYYVEKISEDLSYSECIINSTKKLNIKNWIEAEQIKLKSKYSIDDIKGLKHLCFGTGTPPYLRGPYSTMYCEKKWTIRQYAGFSTAEESNKFYKKNLAAGQSGLSVAFDLPTHRGYDSDHYRVVGDVGKAGVAIDSVDDMGILFKGIDLQKTSVSMTMNGAILPIMAFFIVTLQKHKIPLDQVRGTIQNDILKEFMVRNTYIYPPKESMHIVSDIFKYCAKYMPKFNTISVSGYHMLEAGASADIELAYTLSDAIEYIKTGISSGLKVDDFAPRLSFFWGIGMNFFTEIAKLRAARNLWAEMIQEFKPKNPKSMMLRCHCQTSGWSLTAQEPENNITRTTIEAIAAVIGGTQSLHTNALDEAISLPTDYSAKIARDTQLFLQNKTDLCQTIDPFGGAYYLEKLTHEIQEKAKKHIQEIENAGGMLEAIEKGIPKLKIEASAIRRQTQIDNNKNIIIGLNAFKNQKESQLDVLEINNQKVQKLQIQKITKLKENRDENLLKKSLYKITESCHTKKENLLALAVEAAQIGATLGEISYACEKAFKRHEAKTSLNSGIYAMEQENETQFSLAKKLTDTFKQKRGRRPRILAAKLGQDGHDRGIKIIATSFSDIGFDVDIAPLFQTPQEIAKQAIENDVHIIGVSSLAGGHKTLIPNLIKVLKKHNREEIIIVAGGIIPKKDYEYLQREGVKQIFGPGTIVIEAAIDILNQLL